MFRWTSVFVLSTALAIPGLAEAAVSGQTSPELRAQQDETLVAAKKKGEGKKKGKKKGRSTKFRTSLRVGPSFDINDWDNQFKLGVGVEKPVQGMFSVFVPVDMGFYNHFFTLAALPGVKVRPARFDAPFDFFVTGGLGPLYVNPDGFGDDLGLALRAGLGGELSLAKSVDAPVTAGIEADYTLAPIGFSGTPMYVDLLLTIGYKLPF